MDQSVAIQETLAKGEYCIIISLALGSGREGVEISICSLSLSYTEIGKPVFTKYSHGSGFSTRCFKYADILPTSCEVGDYYTHFADEEGSEK